MPVNENIADFMRRYKDEHHLSVSDLAKLLGIAKSAAVSYLSGDCNPRTDTVELIAEKCGVSAAEIISAQPPGWEQAEIVERAARLFGDLPPEQRERAVNLFLLLVAELARDEQT